MSFSRHHPLLCSPGNPITRLFALLCVSLLLFGCQPTAEDNSLQRALSNNDIAGFQRALNPRAFTFPQDHAAHSGYKNEWWYFTGNLNTAEGRRFGYQVTFFRIALSAEIPKRQSAWAADHIWMAHTAVTDIDSGQHWHDERFSREAVGLAGITSTPWRVWLDDWQLLANGGKFPWQLDLNTDHFSLALTISPDKKIVLQGEQGLSRKSSEPGNASYYYSITRLATSGTIRIGKESYPVTGASWLDREWGTSLLAPDQQGWDWFSLQLHSGEEMMFYQLRKKDGGIDTNSQGSWISPSSEKTTIQPEQIDLTPLDWWQAPNGANYPIRWRIKLNAPSGLPAKEWIVQAAIPRQWMNTSIKYWEGAVIIFDGEGKQELGRGYLEMTGY